MKIGAHLWIGEGLLKTIEHCEYLKCNTFQIFLSNPRSWKRKYREKEEIEKFKGELKKKNINPIAVHMPYILNVAEDDKKIKRRIVEFLEIEIEESEKIGADFYVIHPGFHKDLGEKRGLKNIVELLKNFSNAKIKILIENTSGQGTSLGYNFEHLSFILEKLTSNFGICFDTAHAFQSGYNIKDVEKVKKILKNL